MITLASNLPGKCFAVLLFSSLCLSGCSPVQPEPGNPHDLAVRFRELAFSRLDMSRPLTPPARQSLLEFIDHGALRLERDGATPERVAVAETNLGRFIAILIEESNRLTLHEVDLSTFSASRRALCPLYPFC